MDVQHYRIRLSVRVSKPLYSAENCLEFAFGGLNVAVMSHKRDQSLKEAFWLVFSAGGFPSQEDAAEFGGHLKSAVSIAGLATLIGADIGRDRASSDMSEEFARALGFVKGDERVASNVHGLMIYPDDGKTRIPTVEATGVVHADPDMFLRAIAEVAPRQVDAFLWDAIGLLNDAVLAQHALSQIAIAISAVEALGQDQNWTERQRSLLDGLQEYVASCGMADEEEQAEVADAIRRMHRVGLRQGVVRLLGRIGRNDLKREWDRIYGLRSGLFHGTARPADHEVSELAWAAIRLCSAIILTMAQQAGIGLPTVTATTLPHLRPPYGTARESHQLGR